MHSFTSSQDAAVTSPSFEKPMDAQGHQKLPIVLLQIVVARSHVCVEEAHSFMSSQSVALASWYPALHSHTKDPGALTQACWQLCVCATHSFMSSQCTPPNPTLHGHVKLPFVLTQCVLFTHECVLASHSLISMHCVNELLASVKPVKHEHVNDPAELSHTCEQV